MIYQQHWFTDLKMICWEQAMLSGFQTQSGRHGWTGPYQETGALTPSASPSPQSTCR